MRCLGLCSLSVLSGCLLLPSEQGPRKDKPLLDIEMSYHGILLDKDLQEVSLEPKSLLALQQDLAAQMLESSQDPHFDESYKRIFSQQMDESEQIVAHDAFIETMLEADNTLAELYQPTADLLSGVSFDIAGFFEDFWKQHPDLLDLLLREGIIVFEPLEPVAAGELYIEDCRSHDVPIPPDWPSDAWQWRDDLDRSLAFLANDRIAVYTYEDPAVAGLCVALPRIDGGSLALMGIICQSATTGAACFWDNRDAQTRARIRGPVEQPMPIARLMNGDTLDETCTNCHRGENVFIVHPASALDLRPASDTSAWYTPISAQPWENPPPFAERGSSACSSCHAIGALSSGYCSVLAKAADRTMPPGGAPAGWNTTTGPYADDLRRLREACGE